MSIGNPVMAVKGTIILGGFCLQLGRFAVVLTSLPISTVSVVESFNLRGGVEIFSFCLMLVGVGGGARGWRLVSSWETGFVRVFLGGGHIHCCGNGGWRFRPYGESLLSNDTKGTKKSRPERTAPRQGSGFLRSGIHPGASPSGWLRWHLHAMCSTASNGAARPSPDEHLHSASRGGGWIKIKSGRRANARPCRSELARDGRQR
jgi:hypothetical protein